MTEPGPLTRKVIEYQEVMKRLVPSAHEPQDWDPLAQWVAIDEFERVGTFREVHNWPQYVEMLCQWAGSIGTFETTVKQITELPGLVYFEIEERHFAEERTTVVNSLTVFEFNGDEKIRNIRVYLQQGALITSTPYLLGPRGVPLTRKLLEGDHSADVLTCA